MFCFWIVRSHFNGREDGKCGEQWLRNEDMAGGLFRGSAVSMTTRKAPKAWRRLNLLGARSVWKRWRFRQKAGWERKRSDRNVGSRMNTGALGRRSTAAGLWLDGTPWTVVVEDVGQRSSRRSVLRSLRSVVEDGSRGNKRGSSIEVTAVRGEGRTVEDLAWENNREGGMGMNKGGSGMGYFMTLSAAFMW